MNESCPLPRALGSELRELFAQPYRIGQGLAPETTNRLLELARWISGSEQVALRLLGWAGPAGDDLPVPSPETPNPIDGVALLRLQVPLLPSGEGPQRPFGLLALSPPPLGVDLERLAQHVATQLVHDALTRVDGTDRLTGLLSRSSFERLLSGVAERLADGPASVLMIDLDDMRQLNAARGATSGDQLLATLGAAASEVVGSEGLACRYGGDELALVLPGVSPERAQGVASRLLDTIRKVPGAGSEAPSASIGIASAPEHGDSVSTLVFRADQALARAKDAGRGLVVTWDEDLTQQPRRDRLAGILTGQPARDYRNVQALLETVRAVSGLAPLEETLVEVVDRCVDVSGAARGLLLLKEDGGWKVRVARERGARSLGGARAFAASLADEALAGGRAVTRLAQDELPISPSGDALGLKAVLCAPLAGPDVPAGVVYVDTPEVVRGFDEATIAFFDALTGELASALRNAVLYEKAVSRAEGLARDVAGREAELVRLRRRWAEDRRALLGSHEHLGLVGRSPAMLDVLRTLQSLEGTEVPVVVEGESGVGKELVSRAIHLGSPRRGGPLITVNCAAIAPGLFESELFGHCQGAFTGADTDREGLLEAANGGTLFLDEVGELPLEAQAKLLRALQEREIRRLGESTARPIDVRVVAATNRDLRAMVSSGGFRQDLYYRLAVFRIHVAPLRERPEDIPLLVDHLLTEIRSRGRRVGEPSPAALRELVKRPWRGNVRELRNALERATVLAGSGPIDAEHLEEVDGGAIQGMADSSLLLLPLKEAKAKFAALYTREAIRRADGSVPEAAKRAGVTRQTLYRILSNEPS